jgi:hypothetical protein
LICIAALLGLFVGTAPARADPAGSIDQNCASYCAARGYGQDFCIRACTPQDASNELPPGAEIDWQCMTVCRDRGGQLLDCLTPCRRR